MPRRVHPARRSAAELEHFSAAAVPADTGWAATVTGPDGYEELIPLRYATEEQAQAAAVAILKAISVTIENGRDLE